MSTNDTGVAALSTSGSGLVAEASGPNAAVGIYAYGGGDVIDALASPSTSSSTKNVMSVDTNGNMILAGGLTQHGSPNSTVRDASGAERLAYSQRATQDTIEDFGRAQMTAGHATVRLDPTFASTLADGDYLVFLTGLGRSGVLYVADQSPAGFEIRENGGASTLAIDYRIVGHARAERPEPRLALLDTQHAALATQRLERTGNDIARIAAFHRTAGAKLRERTTQERQHLRQRPVALFKRAAIPRPSFAPQISSAPPNEYGPRLPR